MDKKYVIKNYEVNAHGYIETPGKFEGEMVYAPWFHQAILDGLQDETLIINGVAFDIIEVTDDDKKEFIELVDVTYLKCHTNNEGFFYCTPIDKNRLEELRKEEDEEVKDAE